MSRIIVALSFAIVLMFTGCRTEKPGHHHTRAHRTEYRAGRPGVTHHHYHNHAHPDVPHDEKAR